MAIRIGHCFMDFRKNLKPEQELTRLDASHHHAY